jgi:hypothetical protein
MIREQAGVPKSTMPNSKKIKEKAKCQNNK